MKMYDDAIKDPKILELKDKIALTDAKIAELLQRVDQVPGVDRIKSVQKSIAACFKALKDIGGYEELSIYSALSDLKEQFDVLADEASAWTQIGDWIDRRQRLTESERRRHMEMHSIITADQMMMLISQLVRIIVTHVKDPIARVAISNDLLRLLPPPPGKEIDPRRIIPPEARGSGRNLVREVLEEAREGEIYVDTPQQLEIQG